MRPLVILYTGETGANMAYAQVLDQQGYEVAQCTDTAELRRDARRAVHVQQGCEPVVVVLAATTPLNRSAASILAALPQFGVLAVLDSCDDASLTGALQLGVDAWCPRHCAPDVLALTVHSVMRRLERSNVESACSAIRPFESEAFNLHEQALPAGQWLLHDHAWLLETPAGKRVRLTSSERGFILNLIERPGMTATHIDLLSTGDRPTGETGALKSRVGVLVSRLRRKVAQQGAELPVKSLHNWGYMFTGDIASVDSRRHAAAPQAHITKGVD